MLADERKSELLAELTEAFANPNGVPAHAITLDDFRAELAEQGISLKADAARVFLGKLVDKGEWKKELKNVYRGGQRRRLMFYWKVGSDE